MQGDAVALDVLKQAAGYLANITGVVRQAVFTPTEAVNAAYVGGVFSSEIVLAEFRRYLEADGRTRLSAPRHNPAMGALLEAIRMEKAG